MLKHQLHEDSDLPNSISLSLAMCYLAMVGMDHPEAEAVTSAPSPEVSSLEPGRENKG